jgi:hypothetical protein
MIYSDLILITAWLIGTIIIWTFSIYWYKQYEPTEEKSRDLYGKLLLGLSPLAIGVTIFAFAGGITYLLLIVIPNYLKKKS